MTIEPYLIKKGQIWKNKINGKQFEVLSKDGIRWKCRELSHKQGYYPSTHSFLPFILKQKFTLL